MRPLKVKLVTWHVAPLTDISEAYMVQVNVQRSKAAGNMLNLLGMHSPLDLSKLGYPVIDGVSWLVAPRVVRPGRGEVPVTEEDMAMARRLLAWHPTPPTDKDGKLSPVQSHEYIDDRGRHMWCEKGQEGMFNSVEELVGAYLCCGHWPPTSDCLDVAGWLLRHRIEQT